MKYLKIKGKYINHDGEGEGMIVINKETGLIEEVGAKGEADLDMKGKLIFPGFGDIHIHAREDAEGAQTYKEDFKTMSEAALHGGVTHVADMPNNPKAPVTNERYKEKEKIAGKSLVHVTLYGGIGPDTEPLSFPVPYKAFMGPSVGDLFFTSQEKLEEVIKKYRGQNVSFHCEDPETLQNHEGKPTHEERRPAKAEITATAFALRLIKKYKLQGKLCHYSTGEGLEQIKEAKKAGVSVTCETTPHHLYFDTSMLTPENGKWLRMNPPLRSREDRMACLEALKNGDIDHLATDHAPHTKEEKNAGVSGVPHLDTYGPFTTWLMKEHGFTPQDIARVCAWNPGRFVNPFLAESYGKGFGKVEEGFTGSLTILDMETPVKIEAKNLKTKCAWSPFEGITFPGSVAMTIVHDKNFA